ncbi:RidA family protein [Stappia taiwanensis]|uniref:RidA family protein n=1 Tax=Stappia taiwanensis TaxID=992267 RepID=A0A838XTU1_9HYPH|nr:RidA family protein [Stappia taiwanensis]MBA4612441.1 RidA family protein [Stappia taiwanensis]GGF05431.1 endoribonuclease L-PSP [Stappia taiwanensis]
MTRQVFGTHPRVPLSSAVRAGDFLFLSGQVPFGPDGELVGGDISIQTRRVLDNLAAALQEAGATLSDVVKTTIWLMDPEDFAAFNAVFREYFPKAPPARSCVASALMVDARVEVEAIAYRPVS